MFGRGQSGLGRWQCHFMEAVIVVLNLGDVVPMKAITNLLRP